MPPVRRVVCCSHCCTCMGDMKPGFGRCRRPTRSVPARSDVSRAFAARAMLCALFLVASTPPAGALLVTRNGQTVFDSLGYEKDVPPTPPLYPAVGYWTHSRDSGQTTDGGTMLVTAAASPGAYQGAQYQRILRYNEDAFSDAHFAGPAIASGSIHAEWMLYVPGSSNTAFNGMTLLLDAAGNLMAGVCIDGAGKVRTLNTSGTGWLSTTIPYQVNQWQKWTLDWTIGQSTMTLRVAAATGTVSARTAPAAIAQVRFISPGGGAQFYLDSPAIDQVEPFGISDITWTLGPDHPTYRKGGAAGVLSGMVISAGGCEFPWAEAATVFAWTPGGSAWTQFPDMPQGRCYMDGTSVGDALYVPGGRWAFQTQSSTFRLRLLTGNWTWDSVANLNIHRGYFTVARLGTHIALAGGMQGSGQPPYSESDTLSDVEWYDTAAAAGWQLLPDFTMHSRAGAIVAAASGKLYVFGGTCYQCPNGQNDSLRLADAQVFEPATGQWSSLPRLPFGLSGADAVTYRDRFIVMVGGAAQLTAAQLAAWPQVPGYYSNVVLVYDAKDSRYRVLPTLMPYGTGDIRTALIGDTLYAIGGENIDPATSNTTRWFRIGQIEPLVPSIPGDFDFDADVDQEDFGHFQACLTGPLVTPPLDGCDDADLTGNLRVDQDDFTLFERCVSGPGKQGTPDCAG